MGLWGRGSGIDDSGEGFVFVGFIEAFLGLFGVIFAQFKAEEFSAEFFCDDQGAAAAGEGV
jgi:hypothetical protein